MACGVGCAEVRNLLPGDVDTVRGIIHVRQGKGKKDRMLPMATMPARGISKYIAAEKPRLYLFDGNIYSQRVCAMGHHTGSKKAGIAEEVTLRARRSLICWR